MQLIKKLYASINQYTTGIVKIKVNVKKLYFKLSEILQCKTRNELRKNQQPLGEF